MSGVFITGTDTEIGKTVVSAALIRHLVASGYRCAGMKPVASGCVRHAGNLVNDDALALMSASNVTVSYQDVNPWAFEPPVSPNIAAHQANVTIDTDSITSAYRRLANVAETVVVEGVGGWLVPLAPAISVETLARTLALPVILVVGLRLGCINHALLTERVIEQGSCRLIGWIANHLTSDFSSARENIDTLTGLMHSPLIAEIGYMTDNGKVASMKILRPDLIESTFLN